MLLILALLASMQEIEDEVAQTCIDRSHTQLEMNGCAGQEFARADKALNAEYKATLARMKAEASYGEVGDGRPTGELLLRNSQRAWLTDRDNYCALEAYSARGGSLERFIEARCRAQLTRDRIRYLQNIAPAQDGGE